MKKLFKAMMASMKSEAPLRDVVELKDLAINDYVDLSDSFALPSELRGKTFQVNSIDSYFYSDGLNTEWALKGDTQKKLYLAQTDLGGEDQLEFSYQLKKKEVDSLFGWDQLKALFDKSNDTELSCKNIDAFEGWLAEKYTRSECGAKGTYCAGDYRGKPRQNGDESFTYFSFFNADETLSVEVEVWDEDEIDVFISILRPETDITACYAG
jgi:hypothetical protein